MATFRRFQSAVPNRRGTYPGVVALATGLASSGRLTAADAAWLRRANDNANATYPNPTAATPDCYDRALNPGARSWFRDSAEHLFVLTDPYLELLDRYEVPWVELRTSSPGRIVHEDDVQVVAIPWAHVDHWLP